MVSLLLFRRNFPSEGDKRNSRRRSALMWYSSIAMDLSLVGNWVYAIGVRTDRRDEREGVPQSLLAAQLVFSLLGLVFWILLVTDGRALPCALPRDDEEYDDEETKQRAIEARFLSRQSLWRVFSVLADENPQLLVTVWIDTEYAPFKMTGVGVFNLMTTMFSMVGKLLYFLDPSEFPNLDNTNPRYENNDDGQGRRRSTVGTPLRESQEDLSQPPQPLAISDPTSLAVRQFVGHDHYVFSISMVDDTRFLTTSGDMTIKLWDLNTGECLRTYGGKANLLGPMSTMETHQTEQHSSYVFDVVVSAKKTHFVTVSRDKTARLWSIQQETCIRTFVGHESVVFGVDIVREAEVGDTDLEGNDIPNMEFVTCSADMTARLWTTRGEGGGPMRGTDEDDSIRTFLGHTDAIRGIATLEGGESFATVSRDVTVRLWRVATGDCLRILAVGHINYIFCISALDDAQFVTGSDDRTARLWDINDRRSLVTYENGKGWQGHTGDVNSVCAFRLWKDETPPPRLQPRKKRPSARPLVLTGGWDKRIKLWDAESGKCIQTFVDGHSGSVSAICTTPDGTRFLTGSWDNRIILWTLPKGVLSQRNPPQEQQRLLSPQSEDSV